MFRHQLSIRSKLITIIMGTSCLVLFLVVAGFVASESINFRRHMVDKLSTLAEVVGTNSKLPMTFRDPLGAERILTSLQAEPYIETAYLFGGTGKPMAAYIRPGRRLSESDDCKKMADSANYATETTCFTSRHLALFSPILDENGRRIGTIALQTNLHGLYERLYTLAAISLIFLGGAAALSYVISLRLQGLISSPIRDLAATMKEVTTEQNFTLRATKTTNDEVGTLIDGFNDMLAHIEVRERQLAEHSRTLEHQVARRTSELTHTNDMLQKTVAQLETARDAAEAATLAKSTFLANMSHEIRTPLIGVLGMSEMLGQTPLSDHQRHLTETIQNSGETLMAIINDILDVSKIEAGKMTLEQTTFNLFDTIETTVSLLGEKAFSKGLELICQLPLEQPGPVLGDPVRLRQVLLNLISNAIKFTEQGHIRVSVACEEETASTLRYRLEVEDTGIGILPNVQERIFSPFTQADESTTRTYGGTGLGLTIVHQLTALMGGRLELESEPEHGTLFRLSLEFAKKNPAASSTAQLPEELDGLQVLVAEGHPEVRTLLVKHLRALGAKAMSAESAAATLALLSQSSTPKSAIDLLILGTNMVTESLPELLRDFDRAVPAPPQIVLLGPSRDLQQTLPPEIMHLPKPLCTTRLPQMLKKVLASNRPPVAAPASTEKQDRAVIARPSPAAPSPPACTGRILLAEDNSTTQRLVELILADRPFALTIVDNGDMALQALAEGTFDLVLMDCTMPVMDGFTAAEALRKRGDSTPIVALTARTQDDDVHRCRDAGMDDYLRKPFKQKDLLGMIEKWLHGESVESLERVGKGRGGL